MNLTSLTLTLTAFYQLKKMTWIFLPIRGVLAHTLNLVSTTGAALAETNSQYKTISRATFGKCQALWNKVGRALHSKGIVDQESPVQIICPCSARWNSVFDAVRQLNRISKSSPPASQKLNSICQQLDLPR